METPKSVVLPTVTGLGHSKGQGALPSLKLGVGWREGVGGEGEEGGSGSLYWYFFK